MTDEEYGRAWASAVGKAPKAWGCYWCWMYQYSKSRAPNSKSRAPIANRLPDVLTGLPPLLYGVVRDGRRLRFPTEAAAYAALGSAVREVRRLVPRLEGES